MTHIGMIDDRAIHRLERQIDSWRSRSRDGDERKTYDEVFDQRTLLLIAKLINDGVLATVDYPVATGKEGNVFHATTRDGAALALKIYRVSNSTFKTIATYIQGDSRFRNIGGGHLWVIDCGQAVPHAHPRSEEWFLRDCTNIARYFHRLGVETDPKSLGERIRAE